MCVCLDYIYTSTTSVLRRLAWESRNDLKCCFYSTMCVQNTKRRGLSQHCEQVCSKSTYHRTFLVAWKHTVAKKKRYPTRFEPLTTTTGIGGVTSAPKTRLTSNDLSAVFSSCVWTELFVVQHLMKYTACDCRLRSRRSCHCNLFEQNMSAHGAVRD